MTVDDSVIGEISGISVASDIVEDFVGESISAVVFVFWGDLVIGWSDAGREGGTFQGRFLLLAGQTLPGPAGHAGGRHSGPREDTFHVTTPHHATQGHKTPQNETTVDKMRHPAARGALKTALACGGLSNSTLG